MFNQKLWLIFLVGAILFTGCNSGVPTMKQRLLKFENVLPPVIRQEFKTGQYEKAIQLITDEYRKNSDFKTKLDQVKDDECINIFSIRQVVEFYRDYFVNQKPFR
jgi:hypothetical protein